MSRLILALAPAAALIASAAFAEPAPPIAPAPAPSIAPASAPSAPRRVAAALPAADAGGSDELHLDATPARPRGGRHALYLDVLGRAGLWGVGYDFQPRRWLALGAAASYYSFDGDRITTIAPYVAAYPLGTGRHRGFVQLGPSLVRRTTPSPVAEWSGESSTRINAELCAGYEYRNGVLVRIYAMANRGEHLMPWVGVSLGWTL